MKRPGQPMSTRDLLREREALKLALRAAATILYGSFWTRLKWAFRPQWPKGLT